MRLPATIATRRGAVEGPVGDTEGGDSDTATPMWTVSYTRGYSLGVDPIETLLASSAGRAVAARLGVAPPPTLRRYRPGEPLLVGPALIGSAPGGGRLARAAAGILQDAGGRGG